MASRGNTETHFSIFRAALEHSLLEVAMRCHRCQGWMVNEKYYGVGLPFWGWRCVCCGEILDPLIWKNRNHRRKPPLVERQGTWAERRGS